MKMRRLKKIAAISLAAVMCVPTLAFGADNDQGGSFTTSFDRLSPVLTVNVPVNLDIKVNPIYDNTSTDADRRFSIASKSIDIMNASVIAGENNNHDDMTVPVVATIQAAISAQADDVVVHYNTFTKNDSSIKKEVYLTLQEADTAAVMATASDAAAAFDTNGKLDLTKFSVTGTKADYSSGSNKTAITKYGSLLSMDIAGPTLTGSGNDYTSDATKVLPSVGSFAVTGEANANADWKSTDLTVNVTYNIKPSSALTFTTPTLAAVTATASGENYEIDFSSIDSARNGSDIVGIAVHNDEDTYKDYLFPIEDKDQITIDYTTKKIKIAKTEGGAAYLKDNLAGKAQDFVIALKDGRMIVTTLTIPTT